MRWLLILEQPESYICILFIFFSLSSHISSFQIAHSFFSPSLWLWLHYQLETAILFNLGLWRHTTEKLQTVFRETCDSTNTISNIWIDSLQLIQEKVRCGGNGWISGQTFSTAILLSLLHEMPLLHFCTCCNLHFLPPPHIVFLSSFICDDQQKSAAHIFLHAFWKA